VPLPVQGLEEIRRVCKPNGKIVMLEHVRSENKIIGPLMDLVNPLPLYFYGANINRNTVDNLKKAGFINIQVQDLWLDIFKKIIIINEK
jgi:ubiquinone/menaquinone biosynthesis C-methylase UbiE